MRTELIREKMRERGLTVRALAKSSGLNHATVRRLLDDGDDSDGGFTVRTVEKVCSALAIEPVSLFIYSNDQFMWNLKRVMRSLGVKFDDHGEASLGTSVAVEDDNTVHIHRFHETSSDDDDDDSVRFVTAGEFRWCGQWVELFRDETEWCPKSFVRKFVKQYETNRSNIEGEDR